MLPGPIAPETVSRSLANWSRDGIVETGRRWVALRRPDLLAEIAGVQTGLAVPGQVRRAPAGWFTGRRTHRLGKPGQKSGEVA